MATVRCLRYLALVTDVLFMVVGLAAAVLLLVLVLPLVSLLSLPKWLLPPLLLPLLPCLAAIPLGCVAFCVTRTEHPWKLVGVAVLQALLTLTLAVLAGWQVVLIFSPRVEADFSALLSESLADPKWNTVFTELRCCGPAGPASYFGLHGVPLGCCRRDVEPDSPGHYCMQMHSQGCVGPATDRIRAVLRDSVALHGCTALLMLLCVASSGFFADALKRANMKRRQQQSAQEDKPLRSPMLNQKF